MSFWEDDLAGMDDFDVSAVWKHRVSAGPPAEYTDTAISGILDTPYTRSRAHRDEDNARMMLAVRSSLISGIVKDQDLIEIDSVDYYVIGIEPDGTGMTVLVLSEDQP